MDRVPCVQYGLGKFHWLIINFLVMPHKIIQPPPPRRGRLTFGWYDDDTTGALLCLNISIRSSVFIWHYNYARRSYTVVSETDLFLVLPRFQDILPPPSGILICLLKR